jgi:transposase-like protein
MPRARRTRDAWRQLVSDWQRSGLSVEAFAAEHELNAHTLTWWRTQFRQEVPPLRFAPVRLSPPPSPPAPAVVDVLIADVTLRVPETVSARRVAELVRAIGARR